MIQIAGKEYPMSFSLAAAKKITGRFGSIKDAKKKAAGDSEKNIEDLIQILEVLISQGCAYKNYFEKDLPKPENAPIQDGKWVPISKEEIEIAINVSDIKEIGERIEKCMGTGTKKEIETRSIVKNAKAAQEK